MLDADNYITFLKHGFLLALALCNSHKFIYGTTLDRYMRPWRLPPPVCYHKQRLGTNLNFLGEIDVFSNSQQFSWPGPCGSLGIREGNRLDTYMKTRLIVTQSLRMQKEFENLPLSNILS